MYFQQILNQLHGCASYLIASRTTGDAAVVDPGMATEPYDEMVAQRGLRLRYVVDTHIHADHISGARRLAAAHGAALCLYAGARTAYPFRGLEDGEELPLGQVRLRVLHAPGHRPELIALLVADTERAPEPSLVLTADALLAGDAGRPDFGGGDAAAQFDTFHRLLALPEWMAVFPGHFEGPCGANMDGRPFTTIGFEQRFNPLARLDRDAFIAALTKHLPERPLNMTAIEATNRGTAEMDWAMLTSDADVPEVAAADCELPPDAMLLDVREAAEYARGCVPGAVSLPQADLATRLAELPRDRAIVTICRSGARSLRSAQFLAQMGFANVTSVAGGTSAWRKAGRPVETEHT
jgi:glyoxylase-like metal-dependent hydrolase (beta-lactamase superfamily II)/rhodanese-related sulfurtransferase